MKIKIFLTPLILLPSIVFSQVDPSVLSEEFMEGLPSSVREEISVKNSLENESEIEKLFSSDTSLDKSKVLLQKIKEQLNALETRFDAMDGEERSSDGLERFGDSFFQSIQSSFMPVNIPNLNNNYVLDVGDGIDLTLSRGFSAPISKLDIGRDGKVLIPGYGLIQLAGLTISQAEKKVTEYFNVTAPEITPYMQVVRQKDIQILVMGMVESPGIYTISSGSNFVGAINSAGGIASNGSYRSIDHKRNGQLVANYDLYDLFVKGLFNFNIQLRSGDVLFINPKGNSVPISGGVSNPAIFEAKGSETISDLINYAGGFSEDYSGFDYITIKHSSVQNTSFENINLDQIKTQRLLPRDAILVPSYSYDYMASKTKTISIMGSVKNPGDFSFKEGMKISNVIEMAGGYKNNAYVFGAALFRKEAQRMEEVYAQLNYADTVNFIISNIGKPGASVGGSALDLLAEELRSNRFEGRIVADFNLDNLKNDPSLDLEIEDGDVIIVPSLQKIVYLFGDFRNPSNIAYDPKLQIKDYLKLVGGTKESAYRKIIIIDPDGKSNIYNTSSLFASLDTGPEIYPGSIIYAPRDIGKLSGVMYASTVAPILSSLAISLASLNSISD